MADQQGAQRVQQLIRTYGCLPDAGDGPVLPEFHPMALSKAIQQEVNRASDYGWSKITIHLDIPDALLLAKFLELSAASRRSR